MASISYGILVCNEHQELNRLLSLLVPFVRSEDEIVVLIDQKKATYEVYDVLAAYPQVLKRDGDFDGNFSKWRNLLTELCSKDWILQIDADELISPEFILNMPDVLQSQGPKGTTTAFALPRVNTVRGLTAEDIERWHWQVNKKGWVNYPDYQVRLFKNDGSCYFEGAVHERLVGGQDILALSQSAGLWHPKDIERQRRQNALYDTYKY